LNLCFNSLFEYIAFMWVLILSLIFYQVFFCNFFIKNFISSIKGTLTLVLLLIRKADYFCEFSRVISKNTNCVCHCLLKTLQISQLHIYSQRHQIPTYRYTFCCGILPSGINSCRLSSWPTRRSCAYKRTSLTFARGFLFTFK
jgi:hypothetical protein